MAGWWLDIDRYADTVGFHGNQNQQFFPDRDYVIDSFNANTPFNQFTWGQLARDLLPNPTTDWLVATSAASTTSIPFRPRLRSRARGSRSVTPSCGSWRSVSSTRPRGRARPDPREGLNGTAARRSAAPLPTVGCRWMAVTPES